MRIVWNVRRPRGCFPFRSADSLLRRTRAGPPQRCLTPPLPSGLSAGPFFAAGRGLIKRLKVGGSFVSLFWRLHLIDEPIS